MDKFLDFLNGFNLQTIFTLGIMMWYFARDIKADMKQQHQRIDQLYHEFQANLNAQSARSDRLYEMFIELVKAKG